jgi:DNA polymerase III alpha subunit
MTRILSAKIIGCKDVFDICMPEVHNFIANDKVVHNCDFGYRVPILAYLKDKYGLGFAQIGTFQKMKIKSAIKHAMFALYGRPSNDFEIKALCDIIPDSPQGLDEDKFIYGYVDSEEVEHKGVVSLISELKMFFDQYPDCEDLIKKLLGLPASLGRHPSAFVISTLDLSDGRVPTFITVDKELGEVQAVQFDGPMCEKSGLVKADILGVTTIQTVSDCIERVRENHKIDLLEEDKTGVAFVYRLPEDSGVYKDFYDRKTDSSFQFNTDLIKGFVRDFAPNKIQDLSALTALARPGALDVEAAPGISATKQYILVRSGQADPIYVHPELEPILKDTYGVVAYQEQLMKILVEIAGYSLEESDQIRSAIAKKKREVMTKAFERVREATLKRGWTTEQAQGLCDVLTAYSNYSFNLSHSRAYAQLGYITMWLKHHYPLEWWASELNMSSEDKMRKYMGIVGGIITPPSLKKPSTKWTILDGKIAAPLTSIKGIGPKPTEELVNSGPFESFEELLNISSSRAFHLGTLAACLKAKALDCFIDMDKPYLEEKTRLVDVFSKIRGKDPRVNNIKLNSIDKSRNRVKQIDPVFAEKDPFKLFLMEREVSKIFSKCLLDDELVCDSLMSNLPALKPTGKKSVPYTMGPKNQDPTFVIRSVASMEALLSKRPDIDQDFYGIFLFKSSTCTKGISKKNNKEWKKLEVELSDGVRTIYCAMWDKDKPLRWQVDSPVIVHGKIQLDWRGRPTFKINSISKIEDIKQRRSA